MIVMGMGVQHDDRQLGQLGGNLLQIADAHASVEQRCPLVADNEVTDDFFRLMRLINGENGGGGFLKLKPRNAGGDAAEDFVFKGGEGAAPPGEFPPWKKEWEVEGGKKKGYWEERLPC